MTAKYLLPCACGQQTTVEPRQAGETIPCSCGRSLQVPTMLDITALEPVPPESVPEPSRSTWGLKHQLRLVGIVLVLAALAIGMWRWLQPPVSAFDALDPEEIQRTCQKLSPSQTWDYWEYMKQGLDRRTDEQYARDVAVHQFWQIVVLVAALLGAAAALLGMVLIVAGMLESKRTRGVRD